MNKIQKRLLEIVWVTIITFRILIMTEPNEKPVPETKGFWNKICIIPGRLDGKVAIVTGANTGIGFYTVSELARRGCQVIMACRSRERAEQARTSILDKYGPANPRHSDVDVGDERVKSSLKAVLPGQLIIEYIDLASLNSVRDFAHRFLAFHSRLDFLINNAGLIWNEHALTEDNFEKTLGTNHLGPFLLTELLLPLLKQTGPTRIIFVSSAVHAWGNLNQPELLIKKENYGMMRAYAQSKLANAVYAKELSRRSGNTQVVVVSLHPGAVNTDIARDLGYGFKRFLATILRPFWIKPWAGAQTTLYTVLCPNLVSGGYYSNCALKQLTQIVLNEDVQKWLRQKSCELVGLTVD